jgi:Ca2+ transporting ATPase
VEKHHYSRYPPDHYPWRHPLQRYISLYIGPEIFGIQSSIGVTEWTVESGKHYCIFFHTFVLLQVFNEINARKLKSTEINVFKHFFNNPLFFVILVLTLVIQFACVEFGGQSLRTVPLSHEEHAYCLILGVLPLIAAPIFKILVPASLFNGLSKKEVPE